MQRVLILSLLASILVPLQGHHYKGLPHYGYFENYPQVPTLEFLKETPSNEMFVTIYNFQGFNLDKVTAPDDVRFYVFIYDLNTDRIYTGTANFTLYSHDKRIYQSGPLQPEQEAIYVLSSKIEEQDNLLLVASFSDSKGEPATVEMPIRITASFAEKHGVWLSILVFFLTVITLKTILNHRTRQAGSDA